MSDIGGRSVLRSEGGDKTLSTGAIRWEVSSDVLDADEINETDRRIRSAIEKAALEAGADRVIGLHNQAPGVRPVLWGDDRP